MTKKKKTTKQPKTHRYSVILFAFSSALFLVTVLSFYVILHKADLLPGPVQAQTGYINWRVFDGGVDDPGTNYSENYLNTGNVSGLKVLWKSATPAAADDSVVVEANVSTSSGLQNLAFVNTIKGNLVAYNALTGAKVWEADPSSADFNGQGTKSSPAIDPSGNYIYAYAIDGYVHKYNIGNGSEVTGGGFPAQVTLLPNDTEKGSASLNIANGYLYMELSGNDGDYGHYVGHVVAINLSSGAKTVWNAECANITQLLYTSGSNYCSNTESGIWARSGVKVDPVTGNVFVVTGNGNYNASSGGNNWGDSILEFNANLTNMIDSYTPTSYANLDSSDQDLGSTAPVILPTQSGSNTPYMLVQGGKDSTLRLINRSNMSGQGGPRHTGGEMSSYSISGEMHEEPAVWKDGSGTTWVFVTSDSGNLWTYKVVTSGGTSSLSLVYEKSIGVISSPFVANGVLYFSGPNVLALNPTTGAQLFSSSSIGVSLNQHWEAPTVVNGEVLTTDNNGYVYALYVPGVTPTAAPTSVSSGGSSSGSSSSSPNNSSGSSAVKQNSTSSAAAKPTTTSTAKPNTTAKTPTTSTANGSTGSSVTPTTSISTVKSQSIFERASSPLFVGSVTVATVVAAGVVFKILALKGIIGSSAFSTYAAAPTGFTSKLRALLAKLLGR
jgi:hypothetical protein